MMIMSRYKKAITFICVTTLLFACSTNNKSDQNTTEENSQSYVEQGVEYFETGDFEKSIEMFDKAIEIDPNNASAYFRRGECFVNMMNIENAIDDFEQAIELNPVFAEAFVSMANVLDQTGRSEEAIDAYGQAIEIDPQLARAYHNRGLTHFKLGNLEQALQDMDNAIEIDPEYSEAYASRGYYYSSTGEYETAMADFGKAIELDPNNSTAYYQRGLAYAFSDQLQLSKNDLTKAIGINPAFSRPYYWLGVIEFEFGNSEGAKEKINKSIELGLPSDLEQMAMETLDHINELTQNGELDQNDASEDRLACVEEVCVKDAYLDIGDDALLVLFNLVDRNDEVIPGNEPEFIDPISLALFTIDDTGIEIFLGGFADIPLEYVNCAVDENSPFSAGTYAATCGILLPLDKFYEPIQDGDEIQVELTDFGFKERAVWFSEVFK